MPEIIDSFKGDYRWLSNFWAAPIEFMGQTYKSTEHFYQCAKAMKYVDVLTILDQEHAADAKRIGKMIYIRTDWDKIKIDVMCLALRLKFTQHADLRKKLIDTGNAELIEGNYWHDNFYGNCACEKCTHKKGENWLGRILMELRIELQDGAA